MVPINTCIRFCASQVAQWVKNPPAVQETRVQSLGREDPWMRAWQLTPAFWPGETNAQRSVAGCSPWGREESDMTEQLHFHFSLSCTGEGNGNPLQCSCLENPRDSGAVGGLMGCRLWGRTESDTTEVT